MNTNDITRLVESIPVNSPDIWTPVQQSGLDWLEDTGKNPTIEGDVRFVIPDIFAAKFPEWFQNRRKTKTLLRTLSSPTGFGACLEWTGSTEGEGYAPKKIRYEMFEIAFGPVPLGRDFQLDHLCNNRRCINPLHIMLAYRSENVERAGKRARTHCKREHLFDPATDRIDKHGTRRCGVCYAEDLEAKRNKTFEPKGQKKGNAVECCNGHARSVHGRKNKRGDWECKKCHAEYMNDVAKQYRRNEKELLDTDLFADLFAGLDLVSA